MARRAAWLLEARPKQIPPDGDWSTLLLLCGRGFGKTRVAAEEAWWYAAHPDHAGHRVAVVSPTQGDLRKVMFEGESGLKARCPPEVLAGGSWDAAYNASGGELAFANGSLVQGFSAEKPGRLRGPQFHAAFCDEMAGWERLRLQETWDMLQFGLRLGERPRCFITTTPKPYPLLYELVKDASVRVVTGSTYENRANLAAPFFRTLTKYEGTELGRQEIHAELVDLDQRAILKAGWWRPWGDWTPDGEALYPARPALAFASVDAAYTEKTENDETAVTVWWVFVDPLGRTRVLLRYAWKDRLEFPALVDRIGETVRNFKLTRLLIEAKGPGLSIAQELRRHRPEVVVHHYNPRGDKIARAHAVSPLLKSGAVFGACKKPDPDGPAVWIEPVAMAIEECRLFPFAKHDDVPDSVAQALDFIERSGFELFEVDAPAPPPLSAGGDKRPLY